MDDRGGGEVRVMGRGCGAVLRAEGCIVEHLAGAAAGARFPR